jgi:hypothetical protein
MATLRVFGMPLGAYQTNAYVVWDGLDPTKGCWIIDPGERPARLIERIRSEGLVPDAEDSNCSMLRGPARSNSPNSVTMAAVRLSGLPSAENTSSGFHTVNTPLRQW